MEQNRHIVCLWWVRECMNKRMMTGAVFYGFIFPSLSTCTGALTTYNQTQSISEPFWQKKLHYFSSEQHNFPLTY